MHVHVVVEDKPYELSCVPGAIVQTATLRQSRIYMYCVYMYIYIPGWGKSGGSYWCGQQTGCHGNRIFASVSVDGAGSAAGHGSADVWLVSSLLWSPTEASLEVVGASQVTQWRRHHCVSEDVPHTELIPWPNLKQNQTKKKNEPADVLYSSLYVH